MVENMRNANPSETVKIKTHHARIVVDGTADKPYYSIEWFDPIKKEYYLGYSSYYIGTVFNWLSECFEIVEANTTNADRIRAMRDEELAQMLYNGVDAEYCANDPACAAMLDEPDGIPEENCISCLLNWLQQPADDK